MATTKLTITLETDTLTAAREAATGEGVSLSAWLDRAARDRVRAEGARALAEFMASPDGDEFRETLASMAALRAALPALAA